MGEKERESVCEREREIQNEFISERDRVKESERVCVREREIQNEFVSERERERDG